VRKFTPLRSPRPPAVILSAAKDLSPGRAQILRCAQDDSSASVNAYGGTPTIDGSRWSMVGVPLAGILLGGYDISAITAVGRVVSVCDRAS